ncbi:hypothetical protein D9M68_801410 [compost metagenome]
MHFLLQAVGAIQHLFIDLACPAGLRSCQCQLSLGARLHGQALGLQHFLFIDCDIGHRQFVASHAQFGCRVITGAPLLGTSNGRLSRLQGLVGWR